ncbi:MAG TPA: alpha/beta hydrolase-fold protein [Acidimicrobiales bacterium]|nr:alpha/beta hydrolase-fold protein [Acidimicrobiales bacterium]
MPRHARLDAAVSRRRLLRCGLGTAAGVVVAGATGVELVAHGVLPGKSLLDLIDGACDVPSVSLDDRRLGESVSGGFFSRARRRVVGYTVGYPPGHVRGAELPLVVMLHGEGATHTSALPGATPAEAVASTVMGQPLAPMALVTVDGGQGYWHPHLTDDPMAMVVHELIPMLQGWGLGRHPDQIATMGISMGGYGAILVAELYPRPFGAVAAISPAVWTSYAQAMAVNPGAYDSASQFASYDAVTHAAALARTPVRIASGFADPFHPAVVGLTERLGPEAQVVFTGGCHTGPFFRYELPASLGFLGARLAG